MVSVVGVSWLGRAHGPGLTECGDANQLPPPGAMKTQGLKPSSRRKLRPRGLAALTGQGSSISAISAPFGRKKWRMSILSDPVTAEPKHPARWALVKSPQRRDNRGFRVPQLVGTGFTTQVLPLAVPGDVSPRLTPPLLLAWLPFVDNQRRRGCSLASSQLSAQWTRAMRREGAGEARKASRGGDSSDKTRGQSRTRPTTPTVRSPPKKSAITPALGSDRLPVPNSVLLCPSVYAISSFWLVGSYPANSSATFLSQSLKGYALPPGSPHSAPYFN